MILTGKAKEDFLKHLDVEEQWFNDEYVDLFANALIIEWFDSVGIYIHVDNLTNCCDSNMKKKWNSYIKVPFKNRKKVCQWADNRKEAIEQAIIKANEIYNKR